MDIDRGYISPFGNFWDATGKTHTVAAYEFVHDQDIEEHINEFKKMYASKDYTELIMNADIYPCYRYNAVRVDTESVDSIYIPTRQQLRLLKENRLLDELVVGKGWLFDASAELAKREKLFIDYSGGWIAPNGLWFSNKLSGRQNIADHNDHECGAEYIVEEFLGVEDWRGKTENYQYLLFATGWVRIEVGGESMVIKRPTKYQLNTMRRLEVAAIEDYGMLVDLYIDEQEETGDGMNIKKHFTKYSMVAYRNYKNRVMESIK